MALPYQTGNYQGYQYGGNRLNSLRKLGKQGFAGEGYTGTGQNIADLTGEQYTDKSGGLYDPTAGGTWQEQEMAGGKFGGTLNLGDGSLVGKGTGAPLNTAIAQWQANQDAQNAGGTTSGTAPQYGQAGYEEAVLSGQTQAEDYLTTGYDEQLGAYDPYDAAIGLHGPEAQQEFYDNYQMSPGQQWQLQQQQEALHRRRNMLGKSMGGGTEIALSRDAIGFAQQDMSDQLQRMFDATGREGDVTGRRGETLAELAFNTQQGIANARQQAGQDIANHAMKLGLTAAEYDSQYGADIEQLINNGIITRQDITDALNTGTAADFDNLMVNWLDLQTKRAGGAAEIEIA